MTNIKIDDHTAAWLTELAKQARQLYLRRYHAFWTTPNRPGEWVGRFQVTQCHAFLHAVLYHFTGEAVYLERARQHLANHDGAFHFGSLFAGTAYQLIESKLSKAERASFAAGWTANAAAMIQHHILRRIGPDPAAIETWTSVYNHAIASCFYADFARSLFPAEARKHRYQEVTDRVWDVWWRRREFWEQASNYEGFTTCFLLKWAQLRGRSAQLQAAPSFANLLGRYARIVTPAGIVVPYGDSGHNEHATAFAAVFEQVAHQTRQGHWRTLAWDIFRHLQRRRYFNLEPRVQAALAESFYNGRMVYGSVLMTPICHLALAALWADPAVSPVPRRACEGINTHMPLGHALRPQDRRRLPVELLTQDQIVLTGGPAAPSRRTYLLLSAGKALQHDHADAGAILALTRGDSVLLGTNGYLQQALAYHHVFYVQPAGRPQFPDTAADTFVPGEPQCGGEVQAFACDGREGYCRLHFPQYHGRAVELTREVWIHADGAVTLTDRAIAGADGLFGGPLLHAETIRRAGAQRFRLGLRRLNSMTCPGIDNAPGSLLVELVMPGLAACVSRLPVPAVYNEGAYRQFPCNHYAKIWRRSYTARRCLGVGQPLPKGQETVVTLRLTPQ